MKKDCCDVHRQTPWAFSPVCPVYQEISLPVRVTRPVIRPGENDFKSRVTRMVKTLFRD